MALCILAIESETDTSCSIFPRSQRQPQLQVAPVLLPDLLLTIIIQSFERKSLPHIQDAKRSACNKPERVRWTSFQNSYLPCRGLRRKFLLGFIAEE